MTIQDSIIVATLSLVLGMAVGGTIGWCRGRIVGRDMEWCARYFRDIESDRVRRDALGKFKAKGDV